MSLEARVQALLGLVEADRAKRCEAVAREACARASATRSSARAAARARMRSAFKEERERREARIAAAQARLQTHRRLHAQRRAAALLGAGWERLPGVLLERWLDPHSRQAWIGRVVAEAGGALRGQWRIAHPADWPEGERDALRSAVASEGTAPQLEADRTIAAGLRIAAGGNVIDGTIAGLLADRAEIGARLLWHMEDA